jgi:acyl-CoA reductase-like NAD-dependent aldehyde dehydrogenase
MTAAAKNLTPVVLELGGKNPTIVHSSANLRVAARRIAFGRWFNSGQTCTAPDYVLVFKDVAAEFLKHLKEALIEFYGDDPQKSPDYGRIVSTHHFDRLVGLLKSGTIFHGGRHDRNDRFIEATVLVNVSPDSPAMQEEIFGPILPVRRYAAVDDAIAEVNRRDRPLGLYYFGSDDTERCRVLDRTISGGVTLNDVIFHITNEELPFGGVGPSGMGAYHGADGFKTISHAKAVYRQPSINIAKLAGIMPPYGKTTVASAKRQMK